ncbi:PRY1 protein [Plectosphaerella plurivora]|uniref:PRY1 protein n=1 Tax=Plectosphaerella plurivora TaxID=936078 RepID=A0A9P8VGJ5_9PEZI|nr:PRY1 protein [Plectosphaerella plurivora]
MSPTRTPATASQRLLPILLLLLSATAQAQTRVVTVAPELPSNEPEYKDDSSFTTAALNTHNIYRADHDASSLQWNDSLATSSEEYLDSEGSDDDECPPFEHSRAGENLAIGYQNVTQAIEAWGDERDEYNFDDQGFSTATGHFTQMVWKATTDVGCARKFCAVDGREYEGWYLICHYWPPGNVEDQYADEVSIGNYTKPEGGVGAVSARCGLVVSAAIALSAWLVL